MLKGWVFGYMTRIYSYYLVVSGNGWVGISETLLFPISHQWSLPGQAHKMALKSEYCIVRNTLDKGSYNHYQSLCYQLNYKKNWH